MPVSEEELRKLMDYWSEEVFAGGIGYGSCIYEDVLGADDPRRDPSYDPKAPYTEEPHMPTEKSPELIVRREADDFSVTYSSVSNTASHLADRHGRVFALGVLAVCVFAQLWETAQKHELLIKILFAAIIVAYLIARVLSGGSVPGLEGIPGRWLRELLQRSPGRRERRAVARPVTLAA